MKCSKKTLIVCVSVAVALCASSALAGGKNKFSMNGSGGSSSMRMSTARIAMPKVTSGNGNLSQSFGGSNGVKSLKVTKLNSNLLSNSGISTGPPRRHLSTANAVGSTIGKFGVVHDNSVKSQVGSTVGKFGVVNNNKLKNQVGSTIGKFGVIQSNGYCNPGPFPPGKCKPNCFPWPCGNNWGGCYPYPYPYPYPIWGGYNGGFCGTTVVQPVYSPVVQTPVVQTAATQPATVAAGPIDLELVEVRQLDRGDLAKDQGPAYRVTLRNKTGEAIAKAFNVGLAGSIGRQLTPEAAFSATRVEGMQANQMLTVEVRLPAKALNLGVNADGQPVPFSFLTAVADSHQELELANREDDFTTLGRSEIVMVAQK